MAIHLSRIYTRTGDQGQSSLATGERVSKSDPRLEAYGSTDELNCHLGKLRALMESAVELPQVRIRLLPQVAAIQDRIFDLGTMLATTPEKRWASMPQIHDTDIALLEAWIDDYNEELEPLKSFVLPGTSILEAETHLCRSVCRRVERILVQLPEQQIPVDALALSYINRLSDFLFVAGRWIVKNQGLSEILWSQRSSKSPESSP